jgi:hypothetical protein
MHNRTKGLLIVMSGFFGGGLTASVADLPTWPKAGLVCVISVAVSMIFWVFVCPPRAT